MESVCVMIVMTAASERLRESDLSAIQMQIYRAYRTAL
jgi:hypothetical protein